jgi:hypothetical protein
MLNPLLKWGDRRPPQFDGSDYDGEHDQADGRNRSVEDAVYEITFFDTTFVSCLDVGLVHDVSPKAGATRRPPRE